MAGPFWGRKLAPALLAPALIVLVGGCSQLSELRQRRAEDRTLEAVAQRMKALERIEGGGRFEVQSGEAAFDLPFVMRFGRGGLLQVDAEISDGPWSGVGRMRLMSDATATEVLVSAGPGTPGGRAEIPWADSLGLVLRPLLLSVFGGGDMLVRWMLANRCEPVREGRCAGVEISLRMNLERGSVERWTIRDPARRVSFTGFVHSWSHTGPFPRVVTGMIHPYEVGISIEFNEIGLARPGIDEGKSGLAGNLGGGPWFQ